MSLPTLNTEQIEALLGEASGDVSYRSKMAYGNVIQATATVVGGRWTSKRFASAVLREIRDAEWKLSHPARQVVAATGKRAEAYSGPFPRKRHSHRCNHCGESVACYKSHCTMAQLVTKCRWCPNA